MTCSTAADFTGYRKYPLSYLRDDDDEDCSDTCLADKAPSSWN